MTDSSLSAPRSAAEQQRLEAMLREVFEQHLRFNAMIGLRVVSLAPAAPQLAFDMRPELIGQYLHNRLHGGVIATALDTVGGLAVAVSIGEKFHDESAEQVAHRFAHVGTIGLHTSYLRQGIGKTFTATGQVTRLGGRIASVQMRLENEKGLLIATAGADYVVS
ncbi:MAG: thioesterase family protein [Azonexus sp.]|jgi:uncharacterized protein (TIGR00369 family)|nr:thioesterase family protein [Azonexus sp.]